MLQKLFIQNFAIIEHSEIHFSNGVNIITGETGAGKSILLGALSLILGNRADKKAILDTSKKTVIEGFFHLKGNHLTAFFKQNDLDFEEITIVRREISASGKSRAFINDTPVTLETLKALTSQLVDLHQQHESLSITTTSFQRELLDQYANCSKETEEYHSKFTNYQNLKKKLSQKLELERKNQQEYDFLAFQFKELEEANVLKGELQEKEQQLNYFNNIEDVYSRLSNIQNLFNHEEIGITQQLNVALLELQKIETLDSKFSQLFSRLNSATIELGDIQNELEANEMDGTINEEELILLQDRVNLIHRLMDKHHATSEEALLQKQFDLQDQLDSFSSLTEEIKKLRKKIQTHEQQLHMLGDKLSKKRTTEIPAIEKKSLQRLKQVGMPKASIQIHHEKVDELTPFGKDLIQFLFSANSGMKPQALKQVASGGELSRLMLVLKSLVANKTTLATMIFDEIDTGISGDVARKVGQLLESLAQHHQIISITHLPQIAAKGNHHLKVYKTFHKDKTLSNVKELTDTERQYEIAEMLSGANPSETSLKAALELLNENTAC